MCEDVHDRSVGVFDEEAVNAPRLVARSALGRVKIENRIRVRNVRLHDLRHFSASGLITSGCDVVTVQRALGHSSATITLNTYAHLWPTAEDRTRNAAAGMLADVSELLTNR